jgi:hypothetical protein
MASKACEQRVSRRDKTALEAIDEYNACKRRGIPWPYHWLDCTCDSDPLGRCVVPGHYEPTPTPEAASE